MHEILSVAARLRLQVDGGHSSSSTSSFSGGITLLVGGTRTHPQMADIISLRALGLRRSGGLDDMGDD
jgi:hypothetical protein